MEAEKSFFLFFFIFFLYIKKLYFYFNTIIESIEHYENAYF